ncbi:MAG TPA: PASTA domain-containing protein [Candidatus Caccocola faecipullorum]|nr:PASTA domain-containing protein [Candidatus Caccocola faecipullorum]
MGRIHRWGMLVAFLVIIGCAYLGVKMVFVEDKDVAVPGVTGMQLVDALNVLQTRGLLAKVDKVDSSAPEDTVVAQNLSAGEKVSKGKVVLLRVSKGGAAQAIPDVRGLKFEEGVKMLSDAGFKVDRVVRVTDKLTPSGTVIAQNPAAPQRVSSNCMVTLLVSSGAKGENSFVAVPDLRGYGQQAAIDMIEQLGLRLGQTTESPSDAVPEGSVLSSRPKAGSRVPAGSLVSLTFARAPLPTDAPPVEAPPANDQDPARAEAVRKVVIKETKPVTIPTKLPARDETQVVETPAQTAKPAAPAATQTPAQPAQQQQQAQPQQAAKPSGPQKTAKVRYQVPPLTKPLSLKIELMDDYGTRVLKDGTAKSGEYISMNVPYTGEARVTIYLGGDFVWQDRYN